MSDQDASTPGEVETLRAFLTQQRGTLRRQCEGLNAEQLNQPLPPSPITLGGLLKHLSFVEHWWFSQVLHGRDPVGLWADVDWDADPDWEWHTAAQDTPEELFALVDAEVARAEAALEEALAVGGLEQLAKRGRHGRNASLRWILVHMIEEYARHCGHADLVRESVDGATGL